VAAQPIDKGRVSRRDPLRNFQFRIKFETGSTGEYIAGVRSISGLTWTVAQFETWSGGNNMHSYVTPNRVSWEPITLEQGIALDLELESWAEAGRTMALGLGSKTARRNLRIDVWDPVVGGPDFADSTQAAFSYLVHNAWVSKYVALPRFDATTSEIAVSSVEIIHEGWRRNSTQ